MASDSWKQKKPCDTHRIGEETKFTARGTFSKYHSGNLIVFEDLEMSTVTDTTTHVLLKSKVIRLIFLIATENNYSTASSKANVKSSWN